MKLRMLRFRSAEIAALARELKDCTLKERVLNSEGHAQNVIDVYFTAEALNVIDTAAKRDYKTVNEKDKWKYSEKKFRLGYRGQAADAACLFDDYLEGLKTAGSSGPDQFDIKYQNRMFEVKAFNWPYFENGLLTREPECWMVISQYQFNSTQRHYPLYIANLGIQEDFIRILGFMHREDVEHVGVTTPCPDFSLPTVRVEHLKEFTPIKCLDYELSPEHCCSEKRRSTCKESSSCPFNKPEPHGEDESPPYYGHTPEDGKQRST